METPVDLAFKMRFQCWVSNVQPCDVREVVLSKHQLPYSGNSNIQLEHRDDCCNRTLNRRVSKEEMTSPVPVGDSGDTTPDPPTSQSSGSALFSHQWGHGHILNVKSEVKWNSLSHVWLFATQWTVQPMEFSRPEYWSGYPFPSPGDLPNPGLNPGLLHCKQILYQLSYQGSLIRRQTPIQA